MHLVVATFIEEVAGILREGGHDPARPVGSALLYMPRSKNSSSPAILLTGSGRDAAARATSAAIEEISPRSVISMGFAGATRESLLAGDLVIATEVMRLDGAPFFWDRERMSGPIVPDQVLLSLARSAVEMAGVDFDLGALVTLPTIAKNAGMKRWLGDRLGATAVDMETFAVGEVAQEAGLPFLAVRGIVDSSEFDLPDFVSDIGGAPTGNRLLPVLRHLARRPTDVTKVITLGRAAAQARASIASFNSYFSSELGRWDRSVEGEEAA